MAKVERRLTYLPDYESPLNEWREWLTGALALVAGLRVDDFQRHGRQRDDPCTLILSLPAGGRRDFQIDKQGYLMSPTSQRTALVAATDGLIRMGSLTKAEHEDVWTALVTLATVTVDQDDRGEAIDWLDRFVTAAKVVKGMTMRPVERYDALNLLRALPPFNRFAALTLEDPSVEDKRKTRPTLMLDRETGERWIRPSELAAFVRHCVGTTPLSIKTLDSRVSMIGVAREFYEVRRGADHPALVLYRLPAEGSDNDGIPRDGGIGES